jgi:hypothetical protein
MSFADSSTKELMYFVARMRKTQPCACDMFRFILTASLFASCFFGFGQNRLNRLVQFFYAVGVLPWQCGDAAPTTDAVVFLHSFPQPLPPLQVFQKRNTRYRFSVIISA